MVCSKFYVAIVRAVANRKTKVYTQEAGRDLAGFPGPNGYERMRNELAMQEMEANERGTTDIFRDIYP